MIDSMEGISLSSEDIKLIEKRFGHLSRSVQTEVAYNALSVGISIVKEQTKANLNSISAKHGRVRISKKMENGIRTKVQVPRKKEIYAYIHIYGDKRLLWFEKGTKRRYVEFRHKTDRRIRKSEQEKRKLKKKRYTGKIMDTDFFVSALFSSEDRAFRAIKREVFKSINAIWDR